VTDPTTASEPPGLTQGTSSQSDRFGRVLDDPFVEMQISVSLRFEWGEKVSLAAGDTINLGRDHSFSRFARHFEGNISERHATVSRHGDQCYVRDLGSTNGTRVNGEPIPEHEQWPLGPGDRIGLARDPMVVIEVVAGDP
jgi:hypothetical protein